MGRVIGWNWVGKLDPSCHLVDGYPLGMWGIVIRKLRDTCGDIFGHDLHIVDLCM